jgi:CheY-like chemotaxis protein
MQEARHASTLSILLVDDGEVNREITVRMLASRGYACDSAPDGRKALDLCRGKRYDLVFMDCHMPGLDGYQSSTLIRELPGTGRPVIIGMSAKVHGGELELCHSSGMDGMIAKPFTLSELLVKVRSVEAAQDFPSVARSQT